MVSLGEGHSATGVLGLAAYAFSFAACAARMGWEAAKSGPGRNLPVRWYVGLALGQLVLLLDIAFSWRWKVHDLLMHVAMREEVYGVRRVPQQVALALLALGAVGLAGWMVARLRALPGLAMAGAATAVSFALHGVETISYHGVDALLYRRTGGVMVVSLLWSVLAVATGVGAWADGRTAIGDEGFRESSSGKRI